MKRKQWYIIMVSWQTRNWQVDVSCDVLIFVISAELQHVTDNGRGEKRCALLKGLGMQRYESAPLGAEKKKLHIQS